jgi:hypothetical protein
VGGCGFGWGDVFLRRGFVCEDVRGKIRSGCFGGSWTRLVGIFAEMRFGCVRCFFLDAELFDDHIRVVLGKAASMQIEPMINSRALPLNRNLASFNS